ncbi:MAG TPA: hypothetical protein VEW48_01935 [Thermoanaerobaculia bacterium]|nr:hypothetical protein [Thermoanaerobaculia bacterium]
MHPKPWLLAGSAAVLAVLPLSAQTVTLGPEIQISIGAFEQPRATVPALAVDPGGGFLSAWIDHGLRARGFSPADVPLTPVRTLTAVPGAQLLSLGSGRYVVAWSADGVLLAQILDATGASLGPPVVLSYVAGFPFLARDPAGGFVAVWPLFPPPPGPLPFSFFRARHFDAQAQPVGDEITLGPLDGLSGLAVLSGGGFAVVAGGITGVFLQIFGPDGTPAGPRRTLSAGADNPLWKAGIAADSAGRFVAAWTEFPTSQHSTRVWAQRFSPAGQPLGPPVLAAEKQGVYAVLGDVAVRPDGSFLVEWGETPAVSGDWWLAAGDVLARAFDAAGSPLGPAFPVHPAGEHQESEGEAEATADGWLVSWIRFADIQEGVFARRITLSCGTGNDLCLGGGRFRLTASWRVPSTGTHGEGIPLGLSADTGSFWFFAPTNAELVVKVLDGRALNGHFWVFYGSLTNVEFDLTVTDTVTGQRRTYHNPAGTMASRADTEAF